EHVATFNLEMMVQQQVARTAARRTSVQLGRIANTVPTNDDIAQLVGFHAAVKPRVQTLHTFTGRVLTMPQIRRELRRLDRQLRARNGKGVACVALDYLQLVERDKKQGRSENDAVAELSRRAKLLATEFNIP